jgi:hypothetical protein
MLYSFLSPGELERWIAVTPKDLEAKVEALRRALMETSYHDEYARELEQQLRISEEYLTAALREVAYYEAQLMKFTQL